MTCIGRRSLRECKPSFSFRLSLNCQACGAGRWVLPRLCFTQIVWHSQAVTFPVTFCAVILRLGDPSIAGLVLDSPFSDLKAPSFDTCLVSAVKCGSSWEREVLCEELVDGYTNSRVPRQGSDFSTRPRRPLVAAPSRWVIGIALQLVQNLPGPGHLGDQCRRQCSSVWNPKVRNSISAHADFDIYDLAPVQPEAESETLLQAAKSAPRSLELCGSGGMSQSLSSPRCSRPRADSRAPTVSASISPS